MRVDVTEETWLLVRLAQLELTSWEVIMRQTTAGPSWGKTLALLLACADLLPIPLDTRDIERIEFLKKSLHLPTTPLQEPLPPQQSPIPPPSPAPLPEPVPAPAPPQATLPAILVSAPTEVPVPALPLPTPVPLPPMPTNTPPDQATLIRSLRRLVFTDRLLSLEQAYRYCDTAGIPRSALDP